MTQPSLKTQQKQSLQKSSASDHIPKFLTKTFDILEGNEFPHAIIWDKEGSAILIKSTVEIEKILPVYFKHKNFTSFVRQLNLYGFKKIKNGSLQHIYYHQCFQSGKRNLLRLIKRKKDETVEDPTKSSDCDSEKEAQQEGEVLKENKLLKKLHEDISSRINALEGQLKQFAEQNMLLIQIAMKKENEIMCLRNALSLGSLNDPLSTRREEKSPETSYPTEKFFRANGAFKPVVRTKSTSDVRMLTAAHESSALIKVASLNSTKDSDGSDSDRKSEESNTRMTSY